MQPVSSFFRFLMSPTDPTRRGLEGLETATLETFEDKRLDTVASDQAVLLLSTLVLKLSRKIHLFSGFFSFRHQASVGAKVWLSLEKQLLPSFCLQMSNEVIKIKWGSNNRTSYQTNITNLPKEQRWRSTKKRFLGGRFSDRLVRFRPGRHYAKKISMFMHQRDGKNQFQRFRRVLPVALCSCCCSVFSV